MEADHDVAASGDDRAATAIDCAASLAPEPVNRSLFESGSFYLAQRVISFLRLYRDSIDTGPFVVITRTSGPPLPSSARN